MLLLFDFDGTLTASRIGFRLRLRSHPILQLWATSTPAAL